MRKLLLLLVVIFGSTQLCGAKKSSIMFQCNIDRVTHVITFSKNTIYINDGRYERSGSHLSFNKPNVFELGHGAGVVKFQNRKITYIDDNDGSKRTYNCKKMRN